MKEAKMKTVSKAEPDFRVATESRKTPKAAVDGVAGMILPLLKYPEPRTRRSER
jgi:hypothetical protein